LTDPRTAASITAAIEESVAVQEAVRDQLVDRIAEAASWITRCLTEGGKLLLFGNGGSAADSQHLAAEFVGRFEREGRPLAAMALTTDTSALTALANDFGVETMFARQVAALARSGDVVLALSTTGNSPNVVAGVSAAAALGVRTIGLTGRDGGLVGEACDLELRVPSERTARIQEAHILIGHAICDVVEAQLRT
jgi:D-sedoheptulose 7-phosphate isomerase